VEEEAWARGTVGRDKRAEGMFVLILILKLIFYCISFYFILHEYNISTKDKTVCDVNGW